MEWAMIFLGLLLNIFRIILRPFFWLKSQTEKKKIPPVQDELLLMSATQLADRIRKREVTSEHLISVYIQRVREVNSIINAVVEDRFDVALEEAKAVDGFLRETNLAEWELQARKPLLGVPLTVKECCGVEGMKMTLGSLQRIDEKAKADGEPILRLKKAGAIPILISNTPELCYSWETYNYVTGRTKNPYDTRRTAGGSSGGEGALLGSAASVIGVGSDLAGSIRIPAGFNCIFGHKPSRGIISLENLMPEQKSEDILDNLTVGPMCRYAEDLTIMTKVMSGDEENKLGLDDKVDLSQIDVYFMEKGCNSIYQIAVQKEIRRAVRKAVTYLRDNCKSRIIANKFPAVLNGFLYSNPCLMAFDLADPNANTGLKDPKNFSITSELLKLITGKSTYTFNYLYFLASAQSAKRIYGDRLKELKDKAEDLRVNMLSKLGTNGIFIYPNFPITAFHHGESAVISMAIAYPVIFNVLGFPSTAVPMGLDENGLPVSIQVVAAPNQDKLCIAVAKELSKESGWIPPF